MKALPQYLEFLLIVLVMACAMGAGPSIGTVTQFAPSHSAFNPTISERDLRLIAGWFAP